MMVIPLAVAETSIGAAAGVVFVTVRSLNDPTSCVYSLSCSGEELGGLYSRKKVSTSGETIPPNSSTTVEPSIDTLLTSGGKGTWFPKLHASTEGTLSGSSA